MKKRLTREEEFDIMKLVLDKFLWLGFAVMAFGLYQMLQSLVPGVYYLIAGAVVLLLLIVLIVKEYELVRAK